MSDDNLTKDKKTGFRSFIFKNSTCILSALLVALFMLFYMIVFKVAPFGKFSFANTDCFHQMRPLLVVLKEKLQNGEKFSYYWNSGLGGVYLPAYFYYISSPFNLLVVFFEDMNTFISIGVAFKVVFSAGAFGYFISHRKGEVSNSLFFVALSCAYALSNYVCGYYYEIMWLDPLMVFPLIMCGYDKLINQRKPALYVIALGYSLYCNYYLSYIICLFLVLWFLLDNHENIKKFLKDGVLFGVASLLSGGIAAVSLVASYIGLTKTISAGEEILSHTWYGNIFGTIRQLFILTKPVVTSYTEYDANIYAGTILVVTLFAYIFVKGISVGDKIRRLVLMAFLLVSMDESVLNFIWHGFHKQHGVPNRFSFLFIFLMLLTAAEVYKQLEAKNTKAFVAGLILAEILPVVSYIFVDFNSILSSHQVMLITAILTVIYSMLFLVATSEKKIAVKVCSILISIVFMVEVMFNAMVTFKINLLNTELVEAFMNSTYYAVKTTKENDTSVFYRNEISDGTLDNQNALLGMNGVALFNSTVDKEVPVFMQYMGMHTGKNRAIYSQPTYLINDILGVKYSYIYNGGKDFEGDEHYEKMYSEYGVNIFYNASSLSLGYGTNKEIKDYNYKDDDHISENINTLTEDMTGINDIFVDVMPKYSIDFHGCEVGLGDTDYLSLQYENPTAEKYINVSYEIDEDGYYFMDIREKNEDMMTIKINGEVLRETIWLENGLNVLGELKKGDKVEMIISENTGEFYQVNQPVSEVKYFVYRLNKESYQKYLDTLGKNQMEVTTFEAGHVEGKVNLDEGQLLFTSIPYDKGWHVYENGKELEVLKLAQTFVGVDLGPGEHTLTFEYVPEGITPSIIITIVSWILLVGMCIFLKKKNSLPLETKVVPKEPDEV